MFISWLTCALQVFQSTLHIWNCSERESSCSSLTIWTEPSSFWTASPRAMRSLRMSVAAWLFALACSNSRTRSESISSCSSFCLALASLVSSSSFSTSISAFVLLLLEPTFKRLAEIPLLATATDGHSSTHSTIDLTRCLLTTNSC